MVRTKASEAGFSDPDDRVGKAHKAAALQLKKAKQDAGEPAPTESAANAAAKAKRSTSSKKTKKGKKPNKP